MAYTKHSWREKAGSTGLGGDRETWLNNLETQYDEVVSYCTTTLHDTSYYTETQCDATFFYSGNDGTGSGFVCETLDGYTAVQIYASQVNAGTVVIWGSSEASIPAGWGLCNGSDANHPDLRTRLPVAAGSSYVLGETGGAATVSSTAATVTIAGHAITTAELGPHTHTGIVDYRSTSSRVNESYTGTNGPDTGQTSYTDATGSSSTHTHAGSSIAGGQGSAGNNWPAYKAYCYIVKE